MKTQTYKNIIIGFGRAGLALAKAFVQHGEEVLLIERDLEMRGVTYPDVGSTSFKALIEAGREHLSFEKAMQRKEKVREALHNSTYHEVADEKLVTLVGAKASFKEPHTLSLLSPDGKLSSVSAERIFINIGAEYVIPAISGAKKVANVVTSKEMLSLSELPKRLVIIGASPIGLEFASMFATFGSRVTILESQEKFLPQEDGDITAAILADLRAFGIDIRLGVAIDEIQKSQVIAGGVIYPADKILLATGRKPATSDLTLENVGVTLAEDGSIVVDKQLHTSQTHIWALGDVRSGAQHDYLSSDDSRVVLDELFGEGKGKLADRTIIPYSIDITPSLSRVGLNENEAKEKGIPYDLYTLKASAIVRAKTRAEERGLLKGLVDSKTGEILGVTLYMSDSHEVINLVSTVMALQAKADFFQTHIMTHPTMSEALRDLFSPENRVSKVK
ncbi:MAG: FAD-dependent oxidoreductase [Streptococcaceae bacterium]|jgi:pyruvate/2-oxoglutarate dehydrogenase complex dihydrolipoamide dehydrogenase (E3) component|nr:FAD-dependent oxidoreductase [Streptococcaceae bacterium]